MIDLDKKIILKGMKKEKKEQLKHDGTAMRVLLKQIKKEQDDILKNVYDPGNGWSAETRSEFNKLRRDFMRVSKWLAEYKWVL